MDRNNTPGRGGSVGPFPGQYGQPHVYARSVHSGAGNCVCGADLGDTRHVQAAPGVPVPEWVRVKPSAYRYLAGYLDSAGNMLSGLNLSGIGLDGHGEANRLWAIAGYLRTRPAPGDTEPEGEGAR